MGIAHCVFFFNPHVLPVGWLEWWWPYRLYVSTVTVVVVGDRGLYHTVSDHRCWKQQQGLSISEIVEKLNYLQSTFSPKAYSPVVRQNDVYIHHKKKLSPLFPHRPNVPFTQARGNDAIMLLLEKRWLIAYTLHLPAKIFRHL